MHQKALELQRKSVMLQDMKHDQYFVSACLFLASFVLSAFMEMYTFPVSQVAMMDWISWILGVGAVVMFFSGIINHKQR